MTGRPFTKGAVVADFTFSVEPEDIQPVTAIVRDPNPLHFDTSYVEERDLPGRVSQGPINATYAVQAALRC